MPAKCSGESPNRGLSDRGIGSLGVTRFAAPTAWAVRQFVFGEILSELDSHFSAMRIRYMPMKGAYLILAGLAEQIKTRRMVDIDILVDRENIEAATRHFASLDNVRPYTDRWYFERPFFYRFAGKELPVELHFLLNRPERFHLPTSEIFGRARSLGPYLRLPAHEDAAAIAVCHALVHAAYCEFSSETMVDVAAIASLPGFNWGTFELRCAQAGVRRFLGFLFALFPEYQSLANAGLGAGMVDRFHAGMYRRLYRRSPKAVRRALFELPWVKHPIRLAFVSAAENLPGRAPFPDSPSRSARG